MDRFEHGGDVYTHAGALDYSANLNPLGLPPSVKEAIVAAVDTFDVYPDPQCTRLVRSIARFEQVDEQWVVPCAGATDAITRFCRASALQREEGRALVCAPCYKGYEQALEQAGIPIDRHCLRAEEDFRVTERILDDMTDETGLVFLANPNNPTGLCLNRSLIEAVLERAARLDALVALDECFIDLTCEDGLNDLLDRFDNLVIIKALTKTYALAGLRVGYALCASEGVRILLTSLGQMWAVSTPAQVAGVAALQEDTYVEEGRQLVARERTRLAEALEARGMHVIPGQSNYLMFRDFACESGETDASSLYGELLKHSILIRRCENYQGLDGSWYRIAVRTSHENDQLIAALKEVRP
ncbi:MAG: aminotransferase class I/II-fold pyridoxal phosphate-dependent enzyme [Eggerthellaceae bacterium]|nr:aminotransferase class I/II-fold pyridoxal phosphate-dependent enzyme [Eggerthellaceae bacterium]